MFSCISQYSTLRFCYRDFFKVCPHFFLSREGTAIRSVETELNNVPLPAKEDLIAQHFLRVPDQGRSSLSGPVFGASDDRLEEVE